MKTESDAREALRQAEIDEARGLFGSERARHELKIARSYAKSDPEFEWCLTAGAVCEGIRKAYRAA